MNVLGSIAKLTLGVLTKAVGAEVVVDAAKGGVALWKSHFTSHGDALRKALDRATTDAFTALDIALDCGAMLASADQKERALAMRSWLKSLPLPRGAQRQRFLAACRSDLKGMRKGGKLEQGDADLALLIALPSTADETLEREALDELADEAERAGYVSLAFLFRTPTGGVHVLTEAARFFLRKAIGEDATLCRVFLLQRVDELENRQSEVLETVIAVLQEVKAIHDGQDRLAESKDLARRPLRSFDSLSIRDARELTLLKQFRDRIRALPEAARQSTELMNDHGKLLHAAEQFSAASDAFDAALEAAADDSDIAAEVHFNRFHNALQSRDFDVALDALRAASRLRGDLYSLVPHFYEPMQILGAGGFGVAILCQHAVLGASRVIKALFARGDEGAPLFAEAKHLHELEHPHIIRVLNCAFIDPARESRPYLELEWFDGIDLETYVRSRDVLSIDEVLDLAEKLASALEYAHGRNPSILHRDVKPSNVLVRKSDGGFDLKLIDFGLAVEQRLRDDLVRASLDGRSLVAQTTVGTLDYAAPEQLGKIPGVAAGPYSDVYGFGRTCCFALFGEPEPGRSDWNMLPEDLAELLDRCLTKDPRKGRPQRFADVLAALPKPRTRHQAKNASPTASPSPTSHSEPAQDSPRPSAEPTRAEREAPPSDRDARPSGVRDPLDRTSRTSAAPLFAGPIDLPFECVRVIVLHDNRTAILGGAEGTMAAVDLVHGTALEQIEAETWTRDPPGGGEIHYKRKAFFVLERAPEEGCFFTMSHAGDLKLWRWNGAFGMVRSAALLHDHRPRLHAALTAAYGRSGWSSWSCYNQGTPEAKFPRGITDARITPDQTHVLCLTDWFVVFRCRLDGTLVGEPVVMGDAFAIESANEDGSEFFLGMSRSMQGGGGDGIVRCAWRSDGSGVEHRAGVRSGDICRGSFSRIGVDRFLADGRLFSGALDPIEDAARISCERVRLHRTRAGDRIVFPAYQRIDIRDAGSLEPAGEPLVGAFSDEVVDCALVGEHDDIVTLDTKHLRVWSMATRSPMDEQPGSLMRHHLGGFYRATWPAGEGMVFMRGRDGVGLIDLVQRTVSRVETKHPFFAAFARSDRSADLLAIERREDPAPRLSLFGMARAAMRGELQLGSRVTHRLRHFRWVAGGLTSVAEMLIGGESDNASWPIDAGNGPIAIRAGGRRVIILVAGCLFDYDLERQRIEHPLVNVSREGDQQEWYCRTAMAISADGSLLYIRSSQQDVLVVDARSFQRLRVLRGTKSGIANEAFLVPDVAGRIVLTRRGDDSEDELVRVDPDGSAADEVLARGYQNCPNPHAATWLRLDEHHVAVDGYSHEHQANVLRVFDLSAGRVEREFIAGIGSIEAVERVPGKNELATVSGDGTARFWQLPAQTWAVT